METQQDVNIYLNTSTSKIIKNIQEKQNISYLTIFKIDDIYIKYYLLMKLKFAKIEANEELCNKLIMFLTDFKSTEKIIDVPFDKYIIKILKEKIIIKDLKKLIKCLSLIEYEKEDLDHFRKFFGYNQIFGYYKQAVHDVFTSQYTWKEIGIAIQLLENQKLCYKKLLPLFVRINQYIKKKVLDKNIVSCCKILKSAIIYMPENFADSDDLIISIFTYLSMTVTNHTCYAFINDEDAEEIFSVIEILSKYNFKDPEIEKTCVGIYRKIVYDIEILIKNNTTIYEEVFSIIYSLKVIYAINNIIDKFKNIDFPKSDFFNLIISFNLSKIEYIGNDEWMNLNEKYLEVKYRTLDIYHDELNNNFDRVAFFNDLSKIDYPSIILNQINKMKKELLWSDLIVQACSKEKQSEFVSFIFNEYYLNSCDHLIYIDLFIGASLENPDALVNSTYLFTSSNKLDEYQKKWEILSFLYVNKIESLDQRYVTIRKLICNYAIISNCDDYKKIFINSLLERLNETCLYFNPNVLFLFHLYLKNTNFIDLDQGLKIYSYFKSCLINENSILNNGAKRVNNETYLQKNNYKELETIYIAMAAKVLIISKMEISFDDHNVFGLYIDYISAYLSYTQGNYEEKYLEIIKKKLLAFLFKANIEQIHELGKLVNEKNNKISKKTSRFEKKYIELFS